MSCLVSFPPFLLYSLEGNRYGTRKGMKFWLEMLIINSAEELSFSGTQFQYLIEIIFFFRV